MKGNNKKNLKKASAGKRIFISVLIFLLVAVLSASVTFNVLMYKKLNGGQTGVPGTVKPPLDDNNVIVKPIEPDNPDEPSMRALSISPREAVLSADNSAINVSISVTPDVELPDTMIDWFIAFNDSTSAWATDKDVADYATITPTSDGAVDANLSIMQAFGEQIIVTASIRDDSDVSAICTVDYAKKYYISDIAVSELTADTANEFKTVITPDAMYSEGTIDDVITCTGYLKPSQKFVDFVSAVADINELVSDEYVLYLGSAQINAEGDSHAITANKFAFIKSDTTFREGVVATFSGSANITQHMYRLLDYGNAHANADADWDAYVQVINTLDKTAVLTANLAFNNYVRAQAQSGELTAMSDGSYVLNDAFEIVYTFSGEYNKETTYRKSIPFAFSLLPASVTSLSINPGSIIV